MSCKVRDVMVVNRFAHLPVIGVDAVDFILNICSSLCRWQRSAPALLFMSFLTSPRWLRNSVCTPPHNHTLLITQPLYQHSLTSASSCSVQLQGHCSECTLMRLVIVKMKLDRSRTYLVLRRVIHKRISSKHLVRDGTQVWPSMNMPKPPNSPGDICASRVAAGSHGFG